MNPLLDSIAITGLGLVTSLGVTPAQTWEAILAGQTGVGPMPDLEQPLAPGQSGCQAVPLPTRYSPDLPRAARYLRFAIEHALSEAGAPVLTSDRVGVVMGTTLHGMRAAGEFARSGDPRTLSTFLAGPILDHALRGLDITGPALTTCSACSSGLGSIALAVTLLRAGVIDLAVAGGYDSVSEYSYAGFDSLRLIAAGPPRPFAADRDGMKVAEGYGVLILERSTSAAARSAPILATIAGFGETSDAFHLTQPHPDGVGAADAIRTALAAAGVAADQIDLVAAHATATPNNDAAEYAALAAALGDALPATPVVAFKSQLGHTLGGAGAVELILSVMARRAGLVPPTANTPEPDPAFRGLSLLRGTPGPRSIRTTLNLSLGFGGINTAVVLRDRAASPPPPISAGDEPVVTGLGIVLPAAIGRDAFAALLRSGPEITADTGPIPESAYAHLVNARRTRRMSEYAKLTLAATAEACNDAGVADNADFLAGCSAILGTTHGSSPFCESYYTQIVREGLGAANPVLFAEGVPNAAAAHLSMTFGLRGGCQTIIGTRRSGLDALILASLRIREGLWTRAIVSAAEEYSPIVNRAYAACGLYGKGGGGFVTGAGAITLILESRRSAEARGARILAALGPGHWRTAPNHDSAADVARHLGRSGPIRGAYTNAAPDRAALAAMGLDGTSYVGSISAKLPELFSVGPLAALAAAFLESHDGPVALLSSEFTGAAAGIVVRSMFATDSSGATP